MNKTLKKLVASVLISLTTLISFGNCFGSFPLASKAKGWVSSISLGNEMLSKVIRTIIMYFGMGVVLFLDVVIFNLIEFWTDKVIVQNFNYDSNGVFVKRETKGDEQITLTYSQFGKVLQIDVIKNSNTTSLSLFNDKPGKIFEKVGNQYVEISSVTESVGSKTILKLMSNHKIQETKILDNTDYRQMEEKIQFQL